MKTSHRNALQVHSQSINARTHTHQCNRQCVPACLPAPRCLRPWLHVRIRARRSLGARIQAGRRWPPCVHSNERTQQAKTLHSAIGRDRRRGCDGSGRRCRSPARDSDRCCLATGASAVATTALRSVERHASDEVGAWSSPSCVNAGSASLSELARVATEVDTFHITSPSAQRALPLLRALYDSAHAPAGSPAPALDRHRALSLLGRAWGLWDDTDATLDECATALAVGAPPALSDHIGNVTSVVAALRAAVGVPNDEAVSARSRAGTHPLRVLVVGGGPGVV